ncbi:divalent-cation tolerance protein CutA [Paludibacterium yongneupense]|uniref:divalent-cation tolerance protein CutA n=1 Tax=Paludibacterium yongneupense TaxID=400061 RepID=UPI0004019810|nr:divalent-cation tolerance protein CutA [Paludibacterium yongneupense]
MKCLLVFCNAPDAVVAHELASLLVERRLAACVNILAPCRSVYRWQGKVETAEEIPLLIKTTQAAYPALQALLCERHPYELPEIVACDLGPGLPAYLKWVASAVVSSPGDKET